MPRRFQLGELVTRMQRRCDKEGDNSVSTLEWYALASEQYGEMWSLVTFSRYFETKTTITATGAVSYNEPADHLETIGIDLVDTDGRRHPLRERQAQERRGPVITGDAREYVHADDQLYLFPRPASGSYEWLYIPQPPDFSTFASTDPVDVINPHGEAFMLWGVAVKALAKAEKSTDGAIAEREAARQRLLDTVLKKSAYSARRRIVEYECDEGTDW